MLTRETLLNGDYLKAHQALFPAQMLWSLDKIQLSMHSLLHERTPGSPVWVFAYGSLMWNPLVAIEEMQRALLNGWQRRFCIRLNSGRATPDNPGRMLSLDMGGVTEGMAFKIPESELMSELALLWTREMITGLYQPVWADVTLGSGVSVPALVFVSDRTHPLYERDSSVDTVATCVASATGYMGTNTEYLCRLHTSLAAWSIEDRYIDEIFHRLRAFGNSADDKPSLHV